MALDVYKEWLGIPEGERPPDYYTLLRLPQFDDDVEKIGKFYGKLVAKVRMYASGPYSSDSQKLLNELAKAKLCLTDPQRKREYDESLGREFELEPDAFGRVPLENVLVDNDYLTREQVAEAQSFADARGLTLRDACVQMKLLDAVTAARALADHLCTSFVDLGEVIPDDSVLDKVPRNVVKRNSILPLFEDDGVLLVACVDEPEHELEEELRLRFGMPMRVCIAAPLALNQAIAKYYAHGLRDESAIEDVVVSKSSSRKKPKQKKTPRVKEPRKLVSQLDDGERAARRQMGILIMCGATVGSILFDQFVLPHIVRTVDFPFPFNMYLLALILPPIAIAWVLRVFWK